ncbi:MAG: DUF255 domain-containing protein [Actinobacteria bacterium]|nr:DUF255 domain-containing protein [Actinomycetota bacterium]
MLGTVNGVNRLANETSPYLRQHRDNPVDWYPWGTEAFDEARARNVPVLLSVGYSSCHWCHVMAHECFEDVEVAGVMNRLFVNVKVDREERPDVDAVYMDAVQALTQRGGWPMTVFLAPDGSPFYGGTYFPKSGFLKLMEAVDDAWHNKRTDIDTNIAALGDAIRRSSRIEPDSKLPGADVVTHAMQQLAETFDPEWGGFGVAPKFPATMNLDLLIRAYVETRDAGIEQVITTSLDAMASGGVYDHLGGGFARYSVDEKWLVPHFEKMLYDQALLLRLYVHAWQVFGHDRWRQVAEEIIEYVLRDLSHEQGGFYSAEDADSLDEHGHSHEGWFYLWSVAQIRAALPKHLSAAALAWFGVTEEGNFEGSNILNRMHARGHLARTAEMNEARLLLLEARGQRPRPGLDDKVLAEWNAMFLASLAEASSAFQRPDWLAAAVRNGEFLVGVLRQADGRWMRSWQADGGARHHALAADYAHLVDAFTRLGEASGQARWTEHARQCADQLLDRFWDAERGGVFTTADDVDALVVRQKDVFDNATPSANSTAAVALYRLAALTGESRYEHQADRILQLLGRVVHNAPTAFANLLVAVAMHHHGLGEVAVVGNRPDLVSAVQREFLPYGVLAWGEQFDSPLWQHRAEGFAYVCRKYACLTPSDSVEQLRTQLVAR